MLSKKPVQLTLALLFALMPLFMSAQSGPGGAFFREGYKLMKGGNYEQAVVQFDKAIQQEPNQFRYHFVKAQALIKLKRTNEAIIAFEGAVQANPGFADGYNAIAMLHFRNKNINGAVQNLDKAFNAEQDKAKKVRYKLTAARMLLSQNKNSEALAELNQAKSLQPNDTRILGTEGSVHLKMSNWDAAYQSYAQAEKFAREQKQTGCNLGTFISGKAVAAAKLGKDAEFNEAIGVLKADCPKLATATQRKVRATGSGRYLAIANSYLGAKAYDEAIEWINKAIEARDNLSSSYKMAAIAYFRSGQTGPAIDFFQKAAEAQEKEEDRVKLYSQLVNIQFSNNDYNGAVNSINKVLSAKPNNHPMLFTKAQALYKQGQYNEAVSAGQQAYKLVEEKGSPQVKAQYSFLIGMAAKRAGNAEVARASLKRAAVGPFRMAAAEELKSIPAANN